jgi:hypothetical protein
MSLLHSITSSAVARNVGTYLASKQEVRLLDASSRDQFIGEFSKESSNGDGRPSVSTFFAHVSCSVAISRSRLEHQPKSMWTSTPDGVLVCTASKSGLGSLATGASP